jgi:heat shock protein HtpX
MGYWGNTFKTAAFLALLTALVLWFGNFLGGRTGIAIAFVFVVMFNGLMYWFSDRIVLWMYKAKKLPKAHKVSHMVARLSKEAGLPVAPQTYIMHTSNPNAFATGRSPRHSAVAVTDGILELLDEKELEGVLAHELSHVKHRDTLISTIAGVLAGIIAFVADMIRWSAIFGFGSDDDSRGSLIGLLVISILAPIIALIIQLAISRAREYMADEGAARIMGDAKPLARALKKLEHGNKARPLSSTNSRNATSSLFIVNPFRGGFVLELFSTHPPMAKRIAKLEALKI